jgi:hypothetical protein
MLPVRNPSSPLAWFLMCDDFASWWSKICLVVIHEPMVVRGGRELWMQTRGPQEI